MYTKSKEINFWEMYWGNSFTIKIVSLLDAAILNCNIIEY